MEPNIYNQVQYSISKLQHKYINLLLIQCVWNREIWAQNWYIFQLRCSDYRSSNDLHIGVTNSEGCVYEYDSDGLHSDLTASWNQCLAVPLITDSSNSLDPVWKEYWDFTLHSQAQDPSWVMERWKRDWWSCCTVSFILLIWEPYTLYYIFLWWYSGYNWKLVTERTIKSNSLCNCFQKLG